MKSNLSQPRRTPDRPRVGEVYVLVLLASVVLYWATAQPGVSWQDSGMFQWRVLQGDLTGELGLALAHPLYILAAVPLRAFGEAMPTWLNRLSGLGMAVAVANVFLLGWWLTRRLTAALMAAAMLAVAHTSWWLATVAEVYTWSAAGLTTELVLLIWLIAAPRWWKLLLLGLVSGLGLSVHNFALLPLPVYAVTAVVLVARRRLPAWSLPAAAAGWLAGASFLLVLVVQAALVQGWGAAVRSALFGRYQANVTAVGLRSVARALAYVAFNWPGLSLLPVLIGWWGMSRQVGRPAGVALGAVAAIELIFAIRYDVPDQFTFLLPTYVMLALGAAVGIDRLLRLPRRRRRVLVGLVAASLAATPVLYAVLPTLTQRLGIAVRLGARELPFRDEARYWITPWKVNEHSAERFAQAALRQVEPGSLILADSTSVHPLLLVQYYGPAGGGVNIQQNGHWSAQYAGRPDAARDALTAQPTYATSDHPAYVPRGLPPGTELAPAGVLYRVRVPQSEPGAQPSLGE